jgi:hypothetical protein
MANNENNQDRRNPANNIREQNRTQVTPIAPSTDFELVEEPASKVQRIMGWTGRRIGAAVDLPGSSLDRAAGAAGSGIYAASGVPAWAIGNTQVLWEDAKILGRTTKDIGSELWKGTGGIVADTGRNIRSKFGELFSKQDTTWKNFWYKKPWQATKATFSPLTGVVKGGYSYGSGNYYDYRNKKWSNGEHALKRYFDKLSGAEGRGIKGIINGTRMTLGQTFYYGPKSFVDRAVPGVKGVIENTRNLVGDVTALGSDRISAGIYKELPNPNLPPPPFFDNTMNYQGLRSVPPSVDSPAANQPMWNPAHPFVMPNPYQQRVA